MIVLIIDFDFLFYHNVPPMYNMNYTKLDKT